MSHADAGALRDSYRDLSALDRRPEGFRYSATLSDGTPVVALALSEEVRSRVRHDDRFLAALARAGSVRHEALSTPLAWGQASDGGLHCAYPFAKAIELVPGELSPSDVAIVGVRIAGALEAIHDAGLVHGGIATPAISQSTEHGAQLGRFGLFGALCDGGLGVQGAALLLSDPAYVSPEVQTGKTPDERSDIFSLGASLYDLLTGKPPYGGRTTSFVIAAVLSAQGGPEDNERDAIARPVIEALLRAIERAPDDRWPTAAAFARALSLGATSAEMATAQPQRRSWFSTIFGSWFPARRSRKE